MREALEKLRKLNNWDATDVLVVIHLERSMVPHLEKALDNLGLRNSGVELVKEIQNNP